MEIQELSRLIVIGMICRCIQDHRNSDAIAITYYSSIDMERKNGNLGGWEVMCCNGPAEGIFNNLKEAQKKAKQVRKDIWKDAMAEKWGE